MNLRHPSSPRRWATAVTALATVLVLLFPATALAAPGDDGDPAEPGQTQLPLQALGGGEALTLYGRNSSQSVSIPVSAGLTPRELRARVELPAAIAEAFLTVTAGDDIVAETRLGRDDVDAVIPLGGVELSENAAVLTLSARLIPAPGVCVDDLEQPLRLLDPTVVFSGAETAPATVADFLPPILAGLQLFVPAEPSRAEADAAVGLAAAVVAHYGSQPVRVSVAALPDGAAAPTGPSAPMQRQIVIDEKAAAGLSLLPRDGMPALRLGGPADEMRNQTRLLTSDLARVALASAAVAGPLRASPQLPADISVLRDIGEPGVSAIALANPSVTIGIDQARLGRPVRDVGVRLTGSYTPLPNTLAGQVVVSSGGEVLAHWPTDPSGAIDRWVDIPDRLLRRFTDLTVGVQAAGNTGSCGEFQPITLTIDGSSPIRSTPAVPPAPPGFQSLPQALMPKLLIGAGAGDRVSFADTARAAALSTGLQRLSATPLAPELTPFDDALASPNPAVLIAADGWSVDGVALPFQATGKQIDVEGFGPDGRPTTLTLGADTNFGSLQVLWQRDRTLVVATSTGAPELLDRTLAWLDDNPRRWPALTGTVLVTATDRAPITLDLAGPPAAVGPKPGWAPAALLGAVLAVALAAVGWVFVRRGRSGAAG